MATIEKAIPKPDASGVPATNPEDTEVKAIPLVIEFS
jgi:hypothetical protein